MRMCMCAEVCVRLWVYVYMSMYVNICILLYTAQVIEPLDLGRKQPRHDVCDSAVHLLRQSSQHPHKSNFGPRV